MDAGGSCVFYSCVCREFCALPESLRCIARRSAARYVQAVSCGILPNLYVPIGVKPVYLEVWLEILIP